MVNPKNNEKPKKDDNFIEKTWVEKIMPNELKDLQEYFDLEELPDEVQEIIKKVDNKENLNDDELKYIKKFLAEYRGPMKEHDIKGTIKAVEEHKRHITTQQELVALFDNEERFHIKMQFPVDGILTLCEFDIQPLADMQAVNLVMDHAHLFKDVTEEEMEIIGKEAQNQKLTVAEKKVAEKAKIKIAEAEAENQLDVINNLLARQVTPPDFDNVEDNKNFWKKFPILERISLYMRVRDVLGLTERANDKLFLS